MTERCSTSLCETTDPCLWLEGDSGEAGAWATCGVCYTRLQLLPPVEPGRPARMPEHPPARPAHTSIPPALVAALLLAEKAGLHPCNDGSTWRAVDRNYDQLVSDGDVRELRSRGLLVERAAGPFWSTAARLHLPITAVVLDLSAQARALLAGIRPLRPAAR